MMKHKLIARDHLPCEVDNQLQSLRLGVDYVLPEP